MVWVDPEPKEEHEVEDIVAGFLEKIPIPIRNHLEKLDGLNLKENLEELISDMQ